MKKKKVLFSILFIIVVLVIYTFLLLNRTGESLIAIEKNLNTTTQINNQNVTKELGSSVDFNRKLKGFLLVKYRPSPEKDQLVYQDAERGNEKVLANLEGWRRYAYSKPYFYVFLGSESEEPNKDILQFNIYTGEEKIIHLPYELDIDEWHSRFLVTYPEIFYFSYDNNELIPCANSNCLRLHVYNIEKNTDKIISDKIPRVSRGVETITKYEKDAGKIYFQIYSANLASGRMVTNYVLDYNGDGSILETDSAYEEPFGYTDEERYEFDRVEYIFNTQCHEFEMPLIGKQVFRGETSTALIFIACLE